MNLHEALKEVHAGKKVRRAAWSPTVFVMEEGGVVVIQFPGRRGMWCFTPEDREATDWEVKA